MSQTPEQKAAKEAEKAQKAAEKAENQADNTADASEIEQETQKIKILLRCPGYAYWPGDTADLTTEHVTLLVEGKFAELVIEGENEAENE